MMQYSTPDQRDQMQQPSLIVEAHNIDRSFKSGGRMFQVLRNVNLNIGSGEFVVLQGRSGSGKTTLINILTGLDNPDQGEVSILGQPLRPLSEAQRARLRRENVGLLFQNAHLIPTLTAQENVEIALRLLLVPPKQRNQLAQETLERVGLKDKMQHRSQELSGGEQQRVALARALVHRPKFVIADEPTGNLDSLTARNIILLLREIVAQTGMGMLIATHDSRLVSVASRIVRIHDGVLA